MRYLPKSYLLKLTAALFIIFIISGNCARMGNRKVAESPAQVYTEVSYYPSGQQEYSAEYLNGKLDGMNRHWSVDGYLISESEYSNGKPNGIWKTFHANGKLKYETNYFHGQKHGEEKWYYENGQVEREENYKDGTNVGLWTAYSEDGKKDGLWKWYYENGQLKSEQKFNYGKPETEIVRWNVDGTILY